MKYLLIAGDPSGDQHGAKLMLAIKAQDPEAEFRFFGGEKMAAVAGKPVVGLEDLAFMGFTQLLEYTGRIRDNFMKARQTLREYAPDRLILIDYAGFNLRMAKWAYQRGYHVTYYIAPKVWAWRRGRAHKLRKYCHQVLCILPFEVPFLNRYRVNCAYVGSPVLEDVEPFLSIEGAETRASLQLGEQPVLALLPGSRDQEISRILPVMGQMAEQYPKYQTVVAAHDRFSDQYYQEILKNESVRIIRGKTQEILSISRVALVTSGTATLEAAFHGVPQVVCYKTNKLSYFIARLIIKVQYISLVNLILQKSVVSELIQHKFTRESLVRELDGILGDCTRMEGIQRSYMDLIRIVGNHAASERAAQLVVAGQRAR